MLELLGTLNMLIFFSLIASMYLASAPINALMSFFFLVMLSCVVLYKSISDLMPYLQFLVYVGGVLVLLMYMIMISSNVVNLRGIKEKVFLYITPLWFILLIMKTPIESGFYAGSLMYMNFSVIVLMSMLLTFLFIYMCQIIAIGGRTMQIGKGT